MNPSSPWTIENHRPVFPKLSGTVEVDVVVVGGGIAGMTTAYELSKAGKKVALIERSRVGEGVTGWTTAFVTYVTDTPLDALEDRFGIKIGTLAWETGRQSIGELERIVREEKIDCEFERCPAFIFGNNESELKDLSVASYLLQAAGFVSSFEKGELGFENIGYLRVEDQAKFHPVKYLIALASKLTASGAMVFEHTEMTGFESGAGIVVRTPDGEIRAKKLVLATYQPPDNEMFKKRIVSSQTYVLEAGIPAGRLAPGLYWDSQRPYHYFRVDHNGDMDRIILGGEDCPTGTGRNAEHFIALNGFLRQLLPGVNFELKKEWSGEILDTDDGLPFIGALPSNKDVFIATGFSGNGMTFGVAAALIIRDLVLGRSNEAIELFDPSRKQKNN